jgi:hypothetical protein
MIVAVLRSRKTEVPTFLVAGHEVRLICLLSMSSILTQNPDYFVL